MLVAMPRPLMAWMGMMLFGGFIFAWFLAHFGINNSQKAHTEITDSYKINSNLLQK
jgi:prolipoprotein diacylglyceryltransferase